MSRARKWLVSAGATIVAIVAVLAALLFWVLYTSSGLRFALDRGVALMHGQFAYDNASGTLAGTTTIDGLRYRTGDGTKLTVEHAAVDLRPWALLGHTLHVARARIDGITLDLAPSKPSSQPSAFSLKPPLEIVLDDTLLTHIAISESGKPAFAADSLALAGKWSNRQL
ncbi:MAG: pathogenicity protein, partial [Xanthomonadaceae bacterium]|nr:pathogenicity protein [Xanthomonadaceae bacterium]